MAVMLNNPLLINAQYLKRTTKVLQASSPYTRMFWVKFYSVDVGDYQAFGEISWTGEGEQRDNVYLDVFNGYKISGYNEPGATGFAGTITPAEGRWYHITWVRRSMTQFQVYANGILIGTESGNQSARTANYAWTSLGAKDSFGAYPCRASFECHKEWQGALSQAEIRKEMMFMRPQRVANLHSWHPLISNPNEATGKGSNWTIVRGCGWGDVRRYADSPQPEIVPTLRLASLGAGQVEIDIVGGRDLTVVEAATVIPDNPRVIQQTNMGS